MFRQFDTAEREQVGDHPAHAGCLGGHNVEEAIARALVVAGVALQGFDEALK